MKVCLNDLYVLRQDLSKIFGKKMPSNLAATIRRLARKVDEEISDWQPSVNEFLFKWKIKRKEGETEIERTPNVGESDYEEFHKEEIDLFLKNEIILDFKPFDLKLLDDPDIAKQCILEPSIIDMLEGLNEWDEKQKEIKTEKPKIKLLENKEKSE